MHSQPYLHSILQIKFNIKEQLQTFLGIYRPPTFNISAISVVNCFGPWAELGSCQQLEGSGRVGRASAADLFPYVALSEPRPCKPTPCNIQSIPMKVNIQSVTLTGAGTAGLLQV